MLLRSDTLKRHERQHVREAAEGQQSLKRKASTQLSRCPPKHMSQFYSSIEPRLAPVYPKHGMMNERAILPDDVSYLQGSPYDPASRISLSPTYVSIPREASPLHSDFIPAAFDFNLDALNHFLKSGNVEALMGPTNVLANPEPHLSQGSLPRPSDAIKSIWFTTMGEMDLATADLVSSRQMSQTSYSPNIHGEGADMMDIDNAENDVSNRIDELWRQKVRTKLFPKAFDAVGPLPSIEFLVLYFQSSLLILFRIHALIYIFKNSIH